MEQTQLGRDLELLFHEERKAEKQNAQEQQRATRRRKKIEKMFKPSSFAAHIVPFWGAFPRETGQHNRRLWERIERKSALSKLGPIDSLAHLIIAMGWHQHHDHLLIVATHQGVTCPQLTDTYGLHYSNHRMIFRRLNSDLKQIGWHLVSYPLTVQNEPWGWWLEKLE